MEKLNICVDIDGTITEPFFKIEGIDNKPIKFHVEHNCQSNELDKMSREDFMDYYEKYGEEMHKNAIIREHSDTYLQRLSREHNVFFVTARPPRMEKVTERWFKSHGIPKNHIFFLGSHDKLSKAQELDCDIFIEDRYENALQLSEAGIFVLLIDCEYNRDTLNDQIKRVETWDKVYEEIEKYKKVVVE